jgi:hypothetical protein
MTCSQQHKEEMLVLQNDDQKGVLIKKWHHRQWQPMEPFRDEVDCRKKRRVELFTYFIHSTPDENLKILPEKQLLLQN